MHEYRAVVVGTGTARKKPFYIHKKEMTLGILVDEAGFFLL